MNVFLQNEPKEVLEGDTRAEVISNLHILGLTFVVAILDLACLQCRFTVFFALISSKETAI